MAMAAQPDIDLLLIGKTGNGKSATGNSILGKKSFVSKSSTTSVTTEVKTDMTVINGQTISVTDIPGLADTKYDQKTNMAVARQSVKRAVEMLNSGFSAILIVLRFGGRFTEEDQETITMMKSILGQNVVENHCICVLTCGDNFELDLENGDFGSFDEWRAQQTGPMSSLFEECQDRCVLFDNHTKDKTKLCAQRDLLFSHVDDLRSEQPRRFGLRELHLASQEEDLAEESSEIELDVATLLSEIRSERSQITRRSSSSGGGGFTDSDFGMNSLRFRLQSHRSYLERRDRGSGFLSAFITSLVDEEFKMFRGVEDTFWAAGGASNFMVSFGHGGDDDEESDDEEDDEDECRDDEAEGGDYEKCEYNQEEQKNEEEEEAEGEEEDDESDEDEEDEEEEEEDSEQEGDDGTDNDDSSDDDDDDDDNNEEEGNRDPIQAIFGLLKLLTQ